MDGRGGAVGGPDPGIERGRPVPLRHPDSSGPPPGGGTDRPVPVGLLHPLNRVSTLIYCYEGSRPSRPDPLTLTSKADLGVGYLAGTGVALISLLAYQFLSGSGSSFVGFVGTTTGLVLSVALVYLAYWLRQSDLDDDHIWSVSWWGAIGLAVPSFPALGLLVFRVETPFYLEPSILINTGAAGAVIGALFGAVTELEVEYRNVQTLYRRNVVLNRVLRHDVRNDASALLVHTQRIEDELDQAADGETVVQPIRQKADEILALSKTAKSIDRLDRDADRQPVDVVSVVEEVVETARGVHPDADIDTDLPAEAWVHADAMLKSVIDNVVENAIEHNDRDPDIQISIRPPGGELDDVEIRVVDNGPGFHTETMRALSQFEDPGTDATLPHGGLGLWLVRWFVTAYDGELSVTDNDPRGTDVRISLPAATDAGEHSARDAAASSMSV